MITLLTLLVLCGCGTYQSMQQLEADAMMSGDWSAVELRERQIARRERLRPPVCAPGKVAICTNDIGQMACQCMETSGLRGFVRF